ncbi:Survival protein SurE-like phosphatase/nucleotidase [Prunus dulcis]|uniref:Survival protein SurE-like phosphatase/nucleotidase n=1 Tax=Prunus dulcis TaxID=3755 RepID=A0A4Y1R5N3_PRUDU|nr:Survival protein SurE-like phosphatase/nucleotidase [Prunus dulcis]
MVKKDLSYESDMKNAVGVSLPLIYAVVKSIQEEVFPKSCLLNIEIPSSPWTNKVLTASLYGYLQRQRLPKTNIHMVTLDLYLHGTPLISHYAT